MRVLFVSDTHGNLHKYFKNINFVGIKLIVFLGDNETDDLKLFKDINIKKIGFLGNHTPWEKTKVKINIFKEFLIEDISWKKFIFNGKVFFGIPGEIKYIISETVMKGQGIISKLDNTKPHIQDLKNKINLLNKSKPNIILSHFPAFGIMDKPKDFSHRGLFFLKKYIEDFNPKYVVHGHLHKEKSKKIGKTKIQQIYIYKIMDV